MRYHERAARFIVRKVRLIPEDALHQLLGSELKRVEPEVVVFAYYDRVSFQSENGKVQVSKSYGCSHIEDHFYITFDENALVPHSNPKKMRKGITFVVKLNPGGHILGKLLVRLDAINGLGLDKSYNEFQLGHSVIRIGLDIKIMEISDIPHYVVYDIKDNSKNQGFRAFMMERRRLRLADANDEYYGDEGEEQDEDSLGVLLFPRQASMQDVYNKALNSSARITEIDIENSARSSDRMMTARSHFTGVQTPNKDLDKFESIDNPIEYYSSLPTSHSMNNLPNIDSTPQNHQLQRSQTQVEKRRQLSRQGSSRKDILAKVNPAFLNAHRPNQNQNIIHHNNDLVILNQSQQQEGVNFPPMVWMHPIDEGKEDTSVKNISQDNATKSPFAQKQDSKILRKSQSFHLQLNKDDNKPVVGQNESTSFPSPVMILTARQLQEFQESSQNQINKNDGNNINQIKEVIEENNKNDNNYSNTLLQQNRQRHESNDSSMYQFDFDMNYSQNQQDYYNSARSRHQLDAENGFEYERPDFMEDREWNRSHITRKQSHDGHMEIQGTKSSGLAIKQNNVQHLEEESLAKQSAQKGIILQTLNERGEEVQGGSRVEDFRMVNSQVGLKHPETPSFGDSNNINNQQVATDASYNYAQMEGISTFNNTPESLRMNPPPMIPPLRLDQLRSMAQQTEVDFEDAEIQATQTMVDAQVMNSSRLGPRLQDSVTQVIVSTMDQELQLDAEELQPIKTALVDTAIQAGKPPPHTVDFGTGSSPRKFSDFYVQTGCPMSQAVDSCVGHSPRLLQEMQTQAGNPPVVTIDIATGQNFPTFLADAETQFGKPPVLMVDQSTGSTPRVLSNMETQAGTAVSELVDTGVGSSPRILLDTYIQASPTYQDSFTEPIPRETTSQDVQVSVQVGDVQVQTDAIEPQVIVIPPPPPPPLPEMLDFGMQADMSVVQQKEESVLPMMFVVNQDPPAPPTLTTNEIEIQTDVLETEEIAGDEEVGGSRSVRNSSSNLSRAFGRGDSVKISIDIEDDSHSQAHAQLERQLSMRSLSELSFHESTPPTKTDQAQDPRNFQQINFQVPQMDDAAAVHGRSSSGEGASGLSGKSFDTQHSQVATSPGKEAESGTQMLPEMKTSAQNNEAEVVKSKDADVQSVPLSDTAFSRRAFGSDINLTESGFQSNAVNQLEPVEEDGGELQRKLSTGQISWSETEDNLGTRKSTGEMEVQTDMFGRERSASIISQPSDSIARVVGGRDFIHQDSASLRTDTSIAQTKATMEMGIGADFPISLSKRSRSFGIDGTNKGVSGGLYGDEDDDGEEVTTRAIYISSTAARNRGKAIAFSKSGILFDSTEGLGLPESFRRQKYKSRKYSRLEGANDSMLTQENLQAHHARYGNQTEYDWVLDEEDMIRYGMGQNMKNSRQLRRQYSQQDDLFQRRLGSQRHGSDADGASGRLSPSPSFGKKHDNTVYTSSRSRLIQPGDKQSDSRPSTPGWNTGTKKYSGTRDEQSLEDHKNWIRKVLGEGDVEEKSSIRSRVVTPQQAPKPANTQQKPFWVELARAKMRKLVSIQREREAQRGVSPEPEDGVYNDMKYSERGTSTSRMSGDSGGGITVRDPSPMKSSGNARRMVSPMRQSKITKSPLIPKSNDPKEQQGEPEWKKIIRERRLKQQQSQIIIAHQSIVPPTPDTIQQIPEPKLVQPLTAAKTPRKIQPSLSRMYTKMDTMNTSRRQERPVAKRVKAPIAPPTPPPPPPKLGPRVTVETVKAEVKKEIEFKAKNAPHLAGKVGALKNFFDFAKREN